MPHPIRLELLRRAREAYRERGRGFLALLYDRALPYYGLIGDFEALLSGEPGAAELLEETALAIGSYMPEQEAVVVNSTPEGIFVLIISVRDVTGVGEIIWSKKTEADVRRRPDTP